MAETKYFDMDQTEITAAEFYAKLDYKYLIDLFTFENGYRKYTLAERLDFGKIESGHFDTFKTQLENSIGRKINFTNNIRIVYYQYFAKVETDDFLHTRRNLESTQKTDNDHLPKETIHVASSDYPFDKEIYDVYVDKYDLLKRVFFKHPEVTINHVIIYPTGKYISCFGDKCEYLGISKKLE